MGIEMSETAFSHPWTERRRIGRDISWKNRRQESEGWELQGQDNEGGSYRVRRMRSGSKRERRVREGALMTGE